MARIWTGMASAAATATLTGTGGIPPVGWACCLLQPDKDKAKKIRNAGVTAWPEERVQGDPRRPGGLPWGLPHNLDSEFFTEFPLL